MRLWCVWIVGIATLLFASPWTPFGALELLASLGPLLMAISRRIRRESALALGLPLLTLIWLVERESFAPIESLPIEASVLRLLMAWAVFGIGAYLGARAVDGYRSLESVAGYVAFAPPDNHAFEAFSGALEHELTRARRHDRSFVLLSLAPHAASIDFEDAGGLSGELLRALAENRARLELHELLMNELHAYSHIVAARNRVLAIVPEVDASIVSSLVARIAATASAQLGYDTQIGVACFPADAISAAELIRAADEDRVASRLRSLPGKTRDSGDVENDSFSEEPEAIARRTGDRSVGDDPDAPRKVQS